MDSLSTLIQSGSSSQIDGCWLGLDDNVVVGAVELSGDGSGVKEALGDDDESCVGEEDG